MGTFASGSGYTIVQSHPGSALHPAAGLPNLLLGGKSYVAKTCRRKKSNAIIECARTHNNGEDWANFSDGSGAGGSDSAWACSDRSDCDGGIRTNTGVRADFGGELFFAGDRG